MIWGSVLGFPGGIVRLNPGSNPPETALAEYYEVPWNNPKAPVSGYSPRGMDIDRNNVAWVALGSGHLASFDRRKCKGPLNGPTATGQHCPEGWTLYPTPGPNFKNVKDSGSADSHYYDWVDQFDTLGLGKNTPIVTGNWIRFADRAGEREVRGHARALSAGLLRERDGRPHRRSEGRLERQRASGPPGARARRSTARPERERPARWCISRFGPIRWRIRDPAAVFYGSSGEVEETASGAASVGSQIILAFTERTAFGAAVVAGYGARRGVVSRL